MMKIKSFPPDPVRWGEIKMKKIKIAQIGTSEYSHGNFIFNSLKKQSDVFEIAGFAMPENEKEKFPTKMADFEGFTELTVEEILNDPEIEAVAVETEERYITKYALAAANAGKHIHMEKPGGSCLADFEKMISVMKSNQKVFHTGYMYRYNPYVSELLERIKRGELGDITCVEAQMNCEHSRETREWLGEYKGGSLFFLGCHLIDLVLLIKGMPKRIIPFNKTTGLYDIKAEDFGMVLFEYDNGVSFVKVNSTEKGGYARRQLVVAGTKETVELKPIEMFVPGGQFTTKTEYTSSDWEDRGVTVDSPIYDRYDPMMYSFAQIIRGETENPYTYEYELELYKTILKACGVAE